MSSELAESQSRLAVVHAVVYALGLLLLLTGIFGAQITPTPNILINVELGIRTLPFFGVTAGYYF